MELGFGNRLEQNIKTEQTQKLSQEVIQSIQLLALNMNELDEYISEQILENPMLELHPLENSRDEDLRDKSDELDWAEYMSNMTYDDISYFGGGVAAYESEGSGYYADPAADMEQSLEEVLLLQLEFLEEDFYIKSIAAYIIQSLDENGYLSETPEEMAEILKASPEDMSRALKIVQGFEPWGVGAGDLAECLLIQLKAEENDPVAEKIVTDYLEELGRNKMAQIAGELGVSLQRVQQSVELIKKLEPKPGHLFRKGCQPDYVVPDVKLYMKNGHYDVYMNDNALPSLTISPFYQKVLSASDRHSEEGEFLSERLNSAMWLIRTIEQRRETIYNITKVIVDEQRDFFEKGRHHMKPMTLKQVAEKAGVHESTVSRTVNGKYLLTPSGVYELRFFFSAGTSQGPEGEISAKSIQAVIEEIIGEEDPRSPKSDSDIAGILHEKGIDISRRTVAKYREELGIPSSSRRKSFK